MALLTEFQCRLLKALKKDLSMTRRDMVAAWGNLNGLGQLLSDGYITERNNIYSITPKGHAHDVAMNLQRLANNQKSTQKVTEIDNFVSAVTDTVKAYVADEPVTISSDMPITHRALVYLEKHPDCRQVDIRKAIGDLKFSAVSSFRHYILSGQIIKTGKGKGNSTLKMADGWTARKIIDNRYSANDKDKKIDVPVFLPKQAKEAALSDDLQLELTNPEFKHVKPIAVDKAAVSIGLHLLDKPLPGDGIKVDVKTGKAIETGEQLLFDAPQPKKVTPATGGDFRCAYTNDGCLMLIGLQCLPIELNAAQTNDLIAFISDQIMPIGVAI